MSLLMNYNDERFLSVAQLIYTEQFRRDPKLERELDERRKRLMYDDVIYNISFLMTAVRFRDGKIFAGYARWIYDLLCNHMKDLDRDRIMEHMTVHYQVMADILASHAASQLNQDELALAQAFLVQAEAVTKAAVTDVPLSSVFKDGMHYEVRRRYLDALLTSQTQQARSIIDEAHSQGISLTDLYEEVLTKVMYEVGELWHQSILTVDREHYATSVTQTIMSRFYDEIFNSPRKNKTLVSCAVGSELHEIGVRMLSDLFEHSGWNTYYLGAALPENAILQAIDDYKPDLVALSVTMPPYLGVCENIVTAIKNKFPAVKIAVGGQAFRNTDNLWQKWPVDFHSRTAAELVRWAERTFA